MSSPPPRTRVRPAGRTATLTDGPIGPQLWRMALPMIVAILAMMSFNMVDTMFVGRLGTLPLAAMTMTFPIVMLAGSLGLGLGVSASIAVSRAIGRGEESAVKRLTTDALSFGLLLALCLDVIGGLSMDWLVHLLEGTLPTHDLAATYLWTWLPALPFLILPMVGTMALRATGDTLTPSLILIGSNLVNLALDPLLIFGVGPFPRMGIAGAALATVIARGVSCVAILWILIARDRMLTTPFPGLRPVFQSWTLLMKNAIPIALNNLITPLQMGALTRMTAAVSAATVAGFGVASRVEGFTLTGVFALQSVIGVFIGQNAGAARWDRVSAGLRISDRFAFLYSLAGFLLLLALGRSASALFDSNPAVIHAARVYYLVVGLTFGFKALYLVDSAGLNALNRSADATFLTVLGGLVTAVPAAWAGSRLFGMAGLFGGIALGNLVAGLTTTFWLRRAVRREAGRRM